MSQVDRIAILRDVYLNFIDGRDKYKRTFNAIQIAQGATSHVYRINKDIIGKLTELPKIPITVPVVDFGGLNDDEIKINSKLYIWEHLQKIQQDRNLASNIRKTLKHVISLPLYKEIYIDASENVFLVSLERYIPGNVMEQMIQTFGQDETQLTKFTFVLLDILHFLGTKYSFNHNDLHFNNLMVVEADKYNMCSYTSISEYGGKRFTIDNLKYIPVIIDFDFAVINYGEGLSNDKTNSKTQLDDLWKDYFNKEENKALLVIHTLNEHTSLAYSPSIDVAYYTTLLLQNIIGYSFEKNRDKVLNHLQEKCSIGHLLNAVIVGTNDKKNDIMTTDLMNNILIGYYNANSTKDSVNAGIITSFK